MPLPLLTYPLGKSITAFTTLRQGGVSEGSFASFNINPFCGDSEESVATNRQLLAATLDIPEEKIVLPHQTHSDKVAVLTADYWQQTTAERTAFLEGVDAIISSQRGVCIGVSTADCVPILLYDETHHLAAAIHAGWRGVVADIVGKSILQMQTLGSHSADLKAVIAPCISGEAFEVGDEVYEAFYKTHFPMEDIAFRKDNRWHIDLERSVVWQLRSRGVQPENIICTGECTYSHPDRYFSARRHTIHSGRLFTGFVLR